MNDKKPFNNFSNLAKAVELSSPSWDRAEQAGITNLNATLIEKNRYRLETGEEFLHLCSCSYLGLDSHPKVIEGAIKTIEKENTSSWIATSRNRLKMTLLKEFEEALSSYYSVHALTATMCSAASAGLLPLIAAGLFTSGDRPIMIFDKSAHFSMAHMKALCADETEVVSCSPNDIDFIEKLCQKHKTVCYVGDGVNSVGGAAVMDELLRLQEKYHLFLYLDDSHALAALGNKGYGYVRDYCPILNDRTIVVASLAKAFGTSGGLMMLGTEQQKQLTIRYGGPTLWSQGMNAAAIGSSLAVLDIHRTEELHRLQTKLYDNIKLFDSLIESPYKGNPFTIRLIEIGDDEKAIQTCKNLLKKGFYTSAVFFPIVRRGGAGLRVMLRADMEKQDIIRFSEALKKELE